MNIIKLIVVFLLIFSSLFAQNWFQKLVIANLFNSAVNHFDEGRYATADNILNKLLNKDTDDFTHPVELLALKTKYALGEYDQAQALSKRLIKNHAYVPETFMVLGDIFIEKVDVDVAFRMYLRSRQLADEKLLQRLDQRLNRTILLNVSDNTLNEMHLLSSGENETIVFLAQAYSAVYNGRPDDSAMLLSRIDPELIPDSYYGLYEQLQMTTYEPGRKTFTFGVVLPLSGAHAFSGRLFIKGLHQAVNRLNQPFKIVFQIMDNQSDPVKTVHAVEQLEINRNVLAIITVLDEHDSFTAINALHSETMPMIVIGGEKISFTEMGNQIFQLQSDWSDQGRLAARWIAEYLQKDSVAVLAPNDDFGNVITDAFLKEMDALDRTVVKVEKYSGKPNELGKQFQSLRQTAFSLLPHANPYDEFLGMSFDTLDAMFDVDTDDFFELTDDVENNEIKDSAAVVLNTIQALYIPVHPEHVNYIATQFPMHNLRTRLVGNYAWYQPQIITQENIGPHVQNMTILTHNNMRTKTGEKNAMTIIENTNFLLGYDMVGLLATVVNSGITNRYEFVQKLEQVFFDGSAHTFAFSPKNHVNNAIHILHYKDQSFSVVGMFRADTVQFNLLERP